MTPVGTYLVFFVFTHDNRKMQVFYEKIQFWFFFFLTYVERNSHDGCLRCRDVRSDLFSEVSDFLPLLSLLCLSSLPPGV